MGSSYKSPRRLPTKCDKFCQYTCLLYPGSGLAKGRTHRQRKENTMGITRATVAIAVWLVLLVASIAIATFLIFKQRIRGNVTALLTICGRLFIAAFVS